MIVATTRLETIFGDVAIAVHPDDERYSKYIGRQVLHPIKETFIPVIADSSVKRDFGTGKKIFTENKFIHMSKNVYRKRERK